MASNFIHWNVANGVSHIIYNINMSKIYIRNDKPETDEKPRIFKAIISLRELYSANQYDSQIHLPIAIELPNKAAWRPWTCRRRYPPFYTFQKEENMMLGCWENLDCFPCCNIMQYPLLASNSVCMVTQPGILYGYTYFRQGVKFTPRMSAYNKSMCEVKVSVEWLFGDIANYIKFLDLKKKFENRAKQCL